MSERSETMSETIGETRDAIGRIATETDAEGKAKLEELKERLDGDGIGHTDVGESLTYGDDVGWTASCYGGYLSVSLRTGTVESALHAIRDWMGFEPGRVSLSVRPFVIGSGKEGAVKVIEEAAEAYAEWQALERRSDGLPFMFFDRDLADELADCVTACANLAARYGIDLQEALARVEARNEGRGRYDG